MRSIKTIFRQTLSLGVPLVRDAAPSMAEQPTKRGKVRAGNGVAMFLLCLLITPVAILQAVGQAQPDAGPTARETRWRPTRN